MPQSPEVSAGLPKYFDNDGYVCESGVKPKFVLATDYDALRAEKEEISKRLHGEHDAHMDCHKKLEQAESRAEQAEQNARRYEWLRTHYFRDLYT